jgi:hypothetical protein
MQTYFKAILLSLGLLTLTSCCQQRLCFNRCTEKDSYYLDYYQNPPIYTDYPDYHLDSIR